ncbi:hypothetical protein GCM10011507_23370 [Edaphobacter acidisoli]|uniref:Uncharacterized protein n=1 Tax=Edaphobacter acidisoli TaxID=2040573 RepID=A0A916RUI0_9BACT|nr:hypothetical protein GCM10011507_23370 [Edaphobacter acidisoli]
MRGLVRRDTLGKQTAGRSLLPGNGQGRKVRTPQGSVPDNVRDGRFKAAGRPVQQKGYRLSCSFSLGKGEMVR